MLESVKASFLQRKALREQYNKECEDKWLPLFSQIRRDCKQLGRERCNAARNFRSEASKFAEKLHKGEIPEAANTKEFDGVITAQGEYADCLRNRTWLCSTNFFPDGKGGTITTQDCYYDRSCYGEEKRVIAEVEKVLSR